MIAKREKLQYGYLFLTDLISLAISAALVWFVFDGIFNKMIDFRSPDQVIEACFLLGVSYILTFFTFDQSENIITRTKTKALFGADRPFFPKKGRRELLCPLFCSTNSPKMMGLLSL